MGLTRQIALLVTELFRPLTLWVMKGNFIKWMLWTPVIATGFLLLGIATVDEFDFFDFLPFGYLWYLLVFQWMSFWWWALIFYISPRTGDGSTNQKFWNLVMLIWIFIAVLPFVVYLRFF